MRKGRDGGKKWGGKEKNDKNSGHYVIASSQLPEHRPLECRSLVPILEILATYVVVNQTPES